MKKKKESSIILRPTPKNYIGMKSDKMHKTKM